MTRTRKLVQLTLLVSVTALSGLLVSATSAAAAKPIEVESCSNSACVSDPICHYSQWCVCFTTALICDGNEGCD